MSVLNLGYFEISTYILIIGIAFLISFIVFYQISKKKNSKLDIIYVYSIHIVGFAIGSKCMSLISNDMKINLYHFINSGYSFLGGIIGSIVMVSWHCKRYKLDCRSILSNFMVIYPLLYSISKIGCFFNGCCYGMININDINYKLPLPLIDSILMLILFVILLIQSNKQKALVISILFSIFYIIRFFEDYVREVRNRYFLDFTLEQILCGTVILLNVMIITVRSIKKIYLKQRNSKDDLLKGIFLGKL